MKREHTASDTSAEIKSVMQLLEAVDIVKHSSDEHQTARLVEEHALVCEHLPTGLLNSAEVRNGSSHLADQFI